MPVIGGKGHDVAILPLGISSPPAWLQGFESFVYSPNNGNGSPAAITGNGAFQEGVTLTAPAMTGDPDDDNVNPDYAYQWFRNGNAISGGTASTYAVPLTGAGIYKVAITYTDAQGFSATLDSPNQIVSTPNNAPIETPTLSGTFKVGQVVTIDKTPPFKTQITSLDTRQHTNTLGRVPLMEPHGRN